MKKATFSFVLVLMSLIWCIGAFPWGGGHGKEPVFHREWPAGLSDLVNRECRMYGYWVNANDWFFFAGNAEVFNEFVKAYARLKDTPLTLVLHAGRGRTGRLGYGEKKIEFDWEIKALLRGWHPEAPPDPRSDKPGYVIIVEVWLGGQVDLDKVKVPLNVEVKSGGEIEKFISGHEAKRQQAQAPLRDVRTSTGLD